MELEDQVCNASLAEELQKRNIKAISLLHWYFPCQSAKPFVTIHNIDVGLCGCRNIPAYTVGELGDMLEGWHLLKINRIAPGHWQLIGINSNIYKTEADARAALVISLIDNEGTGSR